MLLYSQLSFCLLNPKPWIVWIVIILLQILFCDVMWGQKKNTWLQVISMITAQISYKVLNVAYRKK
jgi:hypothetical protein